MSQAVAKVGDEERRIARPLKVLVPLIQDDLKQGREAAERAGLPYYRAAGEKMLEAKDQMKHGEFRPWLKRNFDISISSARNYMRLAEAMRGEKVRSLTFSNLQQFVEPELRSRISAPSWHEPVKQIVQQVDTHMLNLRRDELNRAEEREAQRTLALQLIDIGYKVLARTATEYVRTHGRSKWVPVSELARVFIGAATIDGKRRVRRQVAAVFNRCLNHGEFLVYEFDAATRRIQAVKILDVASEQERQAAIAQLAKMRDRHQVSTDKYAKAIQVIELNQNMASGAA